MINQFLYKYEFLTGFLYVSPSFNYAVILLKHLSTVTLTRQSVCHQINVNSDTGYGSNNHLTVLTIDTR